MALQLGGIVSGFDTESLISALIANDTKPLDLMQAKKDRLETAKNAWKDVNLRLTNLRNTVNVLKNSATFTSRITTSSNEKVLTAAAGSAAANGTYQLKVTRLASYHRYASETAATLTGDSEANAATALGLSGTFILKAGDSTNTAIITVETTDSLQAISAKINEANSGVTASIVENRLLLKSDTMGTKGQITLEEDSSNTTEILGLGSTAEGLQLSQTTDAEDAVIEYEGLEFTRGSNNISDVINGVTLNLASTSDSSYVYLTVSSDTTKTADAIKAFVDQYNSLINFIEENTFVAAQTELVSRTSTDDLTPYDSTRQRGTLQGDPTIINLEAQLRRMVSRSAEGFSPLLNSLSAIGVTTVNYSDGEKRSGHLTIDEAKLYQALANPTGPAAITTQASVPVKYHTYAGLSAAVITGNDKATAATALGLAGDFEVTGGNGAQSAIITVTATDTLTTIKNKINAASVGVTASISSNQLIITSNNMGEPGRVTLTKLQDDSSGNTNPTAIQVKTGAENIVTSIVNMTGRESITAADGTTVQQAIDSIETFSGLLATQTYTVEDSSGTAKAPGSALANGDVLVVNDSITGTVTRYAVIASKGAFDSLGFAQRNTVSAADNLLRGGQTGPPEIIEQSGSITLEIDGKNYTVQLSGPMTSQEVVKKINSVIGSVATASIDSSNRLIITNRSSGVNSTIKIKEIREDHPGDLAGLGLVQGISNRGKDLDAFFTGKTLATQGTITSHEPLGNNPVTKSGSLVLNIDGQEVTVNFTGNYNIGDIVNRINSDIGTVGQAYLDDNNYLVIRSLKTGDSSTVRVVRVDEGLAGLNLEVGQYAVGEKEMNGLAVTLDAFYEAWVTSGGILAKKESSISTQMSDIQKRMDELTARIDKKVEMLWRQFSNMETKLQELSTQGQWIDIQLSNLLNSSNSK